MGVVELGTTRVGVAVVGCGLREKRLERRPKMLRVFFFF